MAATTMKDQEMRRDALNLAVHMFLEDKLDDKKKILPTAEYFFGYIKDGLKEE